MNTNNELDLLREKLRLSEQRQHALLEHANDAVVIVSLEGKPLYISPTVETILGYTPEELHQLDSSSLVHPDEIAFLAKIWFDAVNNPGVSYHGNISRRRHKNGQWIWIEATTTNMLDNPAIKGIVNNFRDVTANVKAKEQLIYSNRLYDFLSQINQTIVHSHEEQILFEKVCRIAIDHGKFGLAWIALADTENKKIIMQASAGATAVDTVFFTDYTYQAGGPMDQVLCGLPYYVVSEIQTRSNSAFISYANERGFKSAIFLAIKKGGATIGTFNLYSSEKNYFNHQEIALLNEASTDISFALDVFVKDKARKAAEKLLQRSEARLESAQAIAKVGSWEINLQNFELSWSKETYRIFEADPKSFIPTYNRFLAFIPEEERHQVEEAFKDSESSDALHTVGYKIIVSDKTEKYIEQQWKVIPGADGSRNLAIGTCHDITQQKEAEFKLIYANRLYGFISHINQVIVHETEEQRLFTEACRIAIEHGGFKFAWIGLTVPETKKINISASWDATPADLAFFNDYTYDSGGPIENVVNGEDFFVITDIQQQLNDNFNAYAKSRDYKSAICLSLKKMGKVVGTFNMYSSEKHFFTPAEISLLREVTQDISFALDVFEKERQRNEAEKSLKDKEQRLRQTQAIANMGSWEIDFRTGIALWSEELLRIFGLPPENTRQTFESWLASVHPDDFDRVLAIVKHREMTKENTNFHFRILRKDGSVRHIYNYSTYKFDSTGEPVMLTGIAHDITELKTAEANVLKIAEEKNIILESIGDAFFAVDNEWVVTYWNKTAEELLQTPKSSILGHNLWDIFDKNIAIKSYENYHKAMDSGAIVHFQEYYAPVEKWFEISVYPATNALSVYFKDITERIDAEIAKLKMVEDILQRNKDLEQFSFMISHNLRAPVANIIGLAAELNAEHHSPEVKKMLKKELASSSKRLDEVIVDINNILHLKREKKDDKNMVNFTELVDGICQNISDMIAESGASIVTDFSSATGMMTIKSYMYSIFYNLITNSIKYRRPNIPPRIEIKTRKVGAGIVIEFRDNGLGINIERQKEHIFGLYRRFHQHVEGKGMGLFMVKTQVEILGGLISLESAVNEGSCFTIEFFE